MIYFLSLFQTSKLESNRRDKYPICELNHNCLFCVSPTNQFGNSMTFHLRLSFLFVILLSFFDSRAQDDISDSTKWSSFVHPLVLKGDSNFLSFEPLDSVVSQYQFFFTGEEHRKKVNTQLQLNFLLYLHQKANVRNLIVEGGYSYGYLLNSYLESGNERILDKALAVAPICPENMRIMYRAIRRYNQELEQEDRIKVVGIDLEHSPELSLQVLHGLLPEKEFPRKIRKHLEKVQKLHRSRYIDDNQVARMFKRLAKKMDDEPSLFEDYFEEDFPLAKMVVMNTVAAYDFNWFSTMLSAKGWESREKQMFENFLTVQGELQAGGCFAQFGALHTQLSEAISWEFPTIARRLNEETASPVKGEVMAITRYLRSFSEEYEKWEEKDALKDMISFVREAYPGRIVLCRLEGNDGPFSGISNAFQYMIYIDEDLEAIRCR
jgi:hypothetical protein